LFLPTKGISAERALLTIGAEILSTLETPAGVSAAWERYRATHADGDRELITFDWFALALSALFSLGLIDWTAGGRLERRDVSA